MTKSYILDVVVSLDPDLRSIITHFSPVLHCYQFFYFLCSLPEILYDELVWGLNIRSLDLFKTNFWDAVSKFFFPNILISQLNSPTLCSLPRFCTCTVFSTLSSSSSKSEISKTGPVSLQDLSLKPKIAPFSWGKPSSHFFNYSVISCFNSCAYFSQHWDNTCNKLSSGKQSLNISFVTNFNTWSIFKSFSGSVEVNSL